MALMRSVWARFVAVWQGKSTGIRVLIVIGLLLVWPVLLIGVLVALTYEVVAAVDRNDRLTTNAQWAVSVLAVLGVLVVLSAMSPRTPKVADAANAAPTQAVAEAATTQAPSLALTTPSPAPETAAPPTAEAPTTAATVTPTTMQATAKPKAAPTPRATRAATAVPDYMRDPTLLAVVFESSYGISFEDSPLTDGTVRKLGRDASELVMVELTDDPIKSMSVSGPLVGSGMGTDSTVGNLIGAEAVVFGNPKGMTDWVIAQMAAAGTRDREVSKRFGTVVASLQWYPSLGMFTLSFEHD
jgi:hypothetical protein